MDEALSSIKIKSISKPVELDILEKELRTLKIELEAKKSEKETSKEILNKLENKIASKKEQTTALESAWKKEKILIEKQKEIR
jgi:ATP-dependent Clp protease ATP-binding subunit ClpB